MIVMRIDGARSLMFSTPEGVNSVTWELPDPMVVTKISLSWATDDGPFLSLRHRDALSELWKAAEPLSETALSQLIATVKLMVESAMENL
jgi:hypothetical protein